MEFKKRTIRQLADLICGNYDGNPNDGRFKYRTSTGLTLFFEDCETNFIHKGETRSLWVAEVLTQILKDEPQTNPPFPPDLFLKVIETLMDQEDALNEENDRREALAELNITLQREGFEAYYADNNRCYLRHVSTSTVSKGIENPHRPFSKEENERRELLVKYLDKCSEDELIEDILIPLYRQLGFHRVTSAGHVDKALEYGKDIWMRFRLPTQHFLYFGLQAKIGKIDSAGKTEKGNANVSELLNQLSMMLGHEVFDPETNKKHLPDHGFIVSAGTITKQARNWIGNKLDQTKRSQVIFMDREDILNLYIVSNLPLPNGALPIVVTTSDFDDDIPF